MPSEKNPWEFPEWRPISRESALVRQLVGAGATALGRANYANGIGEYYTGFFGLSIGLERLAKLILVADQAISCGGVMPDEKALRRFGHRLGGLTRAANLVAEKYSLQLDYPRPTNAIAGKIVECLDGFADAGTGRYANFAALGDPNLGQEEPIRKWWDEVAELILKEHYYGTQAQVRVEARARAVDELMSPVSMVLHTKETGETMQDVFSASVRTGQTEIVQRYGRYYALSVVRWLSEIFSDLARVASNKYRIHAFYGAWEHFHTYTIDDSFLRTRKVWPLS